MVWYVIPPHPSRGSQLVKMQTANNKSEYWWNGNLFGWMSKVLLTEAEAGAESCEDYCSLQLRDGTEANMTPVIHMWSTC